MKSEKLADKKECEMKQSNDTVLCDLIPDSLQLNPHKHLPKMLIPHGGRVGISLNHFRSVPCPQPGYQDVPGYPHKDENNGIFTNWQVCAGEWWNQLQPHCTDFYGRDLTTDISKCWCPVVTQSIPGKQRKHRFRILLLCQIQPDQIMALSRNNLNTIFLAFAAESNLCRISNHRINELFWKGTLKII